MLTLSVKVEQCSLILTSNIHSEIHQFTPKDGDVQRCTSSVIWTINICIFTDQHIDHLLVSCPNYVWEMEFCYYNSGQSYLKRFDEKQKSVYLASKQCKEGKNLHRLEDSHLHPYELTTPQCPNDLRKPSK